MQQQDPASLSRPTTRIDDQYLRFLWKILIEQEGVIVGRVVPQSSSAAAPEEAAEEDEEQEPASSSKGKGKEKEGSAAAVEEEAAEERAVDVRNVARGLPARKKIKGALPGMKGKATAKKNADKGDAFVLLKPEEYLDVRLDDLKEKYEGLRIALDGNKMFYVLTGKYPGVSPNATERLGG